MGDAFAVLSGCPGLVVGPVAWQVLLPEGLDVSPAVGADDAD